MKSLFKHFNKDLFGGLTAGVVALPLALAFGEQSGMGAVAGLYGAVFLGFIASLLGGTSTQISGPTAPMTAISMVIVAGIVQLHEGALEHALPAILAVFVIAGLLQICMGIFSLGTYIKYIPYPVISGFMTGIGVVIIITQLLPALGYYPTNDEQLLTQFKPAAEEVILEDILKDEAAQDLLVLEDFQETIKRAQNITEQQIEIESRALIKEYSSGVIGTLKNMRRALDNIHPWELLLTLLTLVVIYTVRRFAPRVPSSLVALVSISALAYFIPENIALIGTIPDGFPSVNTDLFLKFKLSTISPYLISAVTLAVLGSVDSLLTSVVADNMTKSRHRPNKELIAQGVGNSIAAFFGGIPGAGATIRTVVNINTGGTTRLSGMIAAIFLLLALLVFGDLMAVVPMAVLAGILITVGIEVMDFKGLRALRSIPISDLLVFIVVLLATVFWDLIYAVGLGMLMSSLIFMKKMGDSTARISTITALSDRKQDQGHQDYHMIPIHLKERIYVKVLKGPLFFGYTSDFTLLSSDITEQATHVIIRMEEVPFTDQSGLFAIEKVFQQLLQLEIQPLLVGMQPQVIYRLENIGVIPGLIGAQYVFDDYQDCISWIALHVK